MFPEPRNAGPHHVLHLCHWSRSAPNPLSSPSSCCGEVLLLKSAPREECLRCRYEEAKPRFRRRRHHCHGLQRRSRRWSQRSRRYEDAAGASWLQILRDARGCSGAQRRLLASRPASSWSRSCPNENDTRLHLGETTGTSSWLQASIVLQ